MIDLIANVPHKVRSFRQNQEQAGLKRNLKLREEYNSIFRCKERDRLKAFNTSDIVVVMHSVDLYLSIDVMLVQMH